MRKPNDDLSWTPNPELMELWPDTSGNTINGLSAIDSRPPSPVFLANGWINYSY